MCAISGCHVAAHAHPDPVEVADQVHRSIEAGARRGEDGFGIAVVTRGGELSLWRSRRPPLRDDVRRLITEDVAGVIAVCRAVPTTEWRPDPPLDDQQPFTSPHWVVGHNGTVANDRTLREELGVRTDTLVDSAVLPHLFEADGIGALDRIEGSFSVAAVDRRQPHVLRLARNFKPLVLRRAAPGVTRFGSIVEQLGDGGETCDVGLDAPAVVTPDPYSAVTIDADGSAELEPLVPAPTQRHALVIASGGLDSTVAAAQLVAEGAEVTLLHLTYGCHAERRETAAVHDVAAALGCGVRFVGLDWLRAIGGSSLTTDATITDAEVGAELPHEWVPARNLVMLAVAAALADVDGHTDIVSGTNLEEGGAYPDNTQEFIAAVDRTVRLGSLARPRVWAPLGDLVKHQIVRRGLELGAPLERTWSCYRGGEIHCGRCGPCFMRRVAFEINGTTDPVPHASPLRRVRPV